jgi:hypothetical protein
MEAKTEAQVDQKKTIQVTRKVTGKDERKHI